MKWFSTEKSATFKVEFPCLLIHREGTFIVLAYGESKDATHFEGVVVSSRRGSFYTGEYSDTWRLARYEPFYGKVTLESKP